MVQVTLVVHAVGVVVALLLALGRAAALGALGAGAWGEGED